jgi:predicted nucleic acid-binding protein
MRPGKTIGYRLRVWPSLRDADDDMVLEVAVNGRADAIVTFNRRDFRPAKFGIEVLLPGAAIERLGGIS